MHGNGADVYCINVVGWFLLTHRHIERCQAIHMLRLPGKSTVQIDYQHLG